MSVTAGDRRRGRHLIAAFALCAACRDSSAPPAPAGLTLNVAPSASARSRIPLAVQPVVQLVDDRGRAVSKGGIAVTVSVTTGTATPNGGTTATTAADGKATFQALALAGQAGDVVLTFASPGLESVTATVGLAAGDAAQMQANDGDGQSAVVASSVPTAPSVKVRDADGNPVSGASVTFAVAAGGGAVTGAAPTTGADGIARVGGWQLGTVAGANTLSATAAGVATPVDIGATALPGPPAQLALLSGGNQTALANANVPAAIAIGVRDQFNNAVSSAATVSFAVIAGGGTVGATATSGADGTVTAPAWRLGKSASAQQLRVTLASLPALDVTASVQTQYHLDVRFFGPAMTQAQRDLFTSAAQRIEGMLIGDVRDAIANNVDVESACGASGVAPLNETIDDLIVYASIADIDGPGKILAQAGPCLFRNAGTVAAPLYMPAVGVMEFDSADLATLSASGSLQDVITHEMLHVVGVGVLWQDRGQVSGGGTPDPRHTGAGARQGCVAVGGTVTCASSVPLENTGGAGTVESHWREATFNNELMTGFLNAGSNPISRLTLESLGDLGYIINSGDFDSYSIPGGMLRASGSLAPEARGEWERRRASGDVRILEADGRVGPSDRARP